VSKKIRVAWDDLKPGDLIHVKGSTNTYVFKGWFLDAASVDHRKSGAETYVITRSKNNSPVDVAIVVTHDNFAYATRPAPKKPRPNIVEPKAPGEYWLRVHAGELNGWYMCIRRQFDSIKDSWDKPSDLRAWQTVMWGIIAFSPWLTWHEMVDGMHVSEVLTAEEYYMRKAKREL
jgi:hypothetical protein